MSRDFDPTSTRRPDVAARPLPLADGGLWSFASTVERLRPAFGKGGQVVGVHRRPGPSPPTRSALSALQMAIESGEEGGAREAMLDVALSLLLAAHDVDPEPARTLIARSLDEDPARIDDILAIALGEPTATEEPIQ